MEHSMILFGLDQSLLYEEALTELRKKSPSQLHYKRKCVLDLQGETNTFTMSDVHFEIDFESANISQSIWTDLYIKIKEILQIKTKLIGRFSGKKSKYKKTYVKLKEGDSITDLFN